jgi:hypothetical protein
MSPPSAQQTACEENQVWNRFREIAEVDFGHGRKKLAEYLKSLTLEEMLGAARCACEEAATDVRLLRTSDEVRMKVGVKHALMCLEYAFEGSDVDSVAHKLLATAANPKEHPWLRAAIAGSTSGFGKYEFGKALRAYARSHWREVWELQNTILTTRQGGMYLRMRAIESLAGILRDQVRIACGSDPNIRGAFKDVEQHGSEFTQIIRLVQSGSVDLDERTLEDLGPVLSKIDESIRLFASIAVATEDEPEQVREKAMQRLDGYRILRVLRLDGQIDKALDEAKH